MRKQRGVLFYVGIALLIVFAASAALAPLLAPYDPRLSTGPPLNAPSQDHLLGTNDLGQDVLSQMIYAARPSLLVAGLVTTISTIVSWLVGLIAGLMQRVEGLLVAGTDLLLALPNIPLYLLVLTLLGPSLHNLIVVLALLSWPAFARIVRSLVLRARSAPHVEASRLLGASTSHIVRVHILPVTLDVLPTNIVLTARFAIAAEATLAFLGLSSGDQVSWGTILSWALADPLLFMRPVWPWLILPPTLAIVVLMLALTWIGSGLIASSAQPSFRHGRKASGDDATIAAPEPKDTTGMAESEHSWLTEGSGSLKPRRSAAPQATIPTS